VFDTERRRGAFAIYNSPGPDLPRPSLRGTSEDPRPRRQSGVHRGEHIMNSVARVTEITARSAKSFEDALQVGINRATKTLRGVTSAWIKEQKVEIKKGKIISYQVNMLVTFVID